MADVGVHGGETLVNFFDIDSTLEGSARSWSPNTLPIRAALNYKEAPYTQTYVALPDIEPMLKSLTVPALTAQIVPYTLPAIRHVPTIAVAGSTLNDSFKIAVHLETVFSPESGYRSLFPRGQSSYALAVAVLRQLHNVFVVVRPVAVPRVPEYLDERSREYFLRTRKVQGQPLELLEAGDELETVWKAIETEIAVFVKMLKGRPAPRSNRGPFFEGDQIGYADMILLGFMGWFARNSQDDFDRLVKMGDGELKKLWDAGHKWLEGQGKNVEYKRPE